MGRNQERVGTRTTHACWMRLAERLLDRDGRTCSKCRHTRGRLDRILITMAREGSPITADRCRQRPIRTVYIEPRPGHALTSVSGWPVRPRIDAEDPWQEFHGAPGNGGHGSETGSRGNWGGPVSVASRPRLAAQSSRLLTRRIRVSHRSQSSGHLVRRTHLPANRCEGQEIADGVDIRPADSACNPASHDGISLYACRPPAAMPSADRVDRDVHWGKQPIRDSRRHNCPKFEPVGPATPLDTGWRLHPASDVPDALVRLESARRERSQSHRRGGRGRAGDHGGRPTGVGAVLDAGTQGRPALPSLSGIPRGSEPRRDGRLVPAPVRVSGTDDILCVGRGTRPL